MVETLALTILSELSMLEDEFDSDRLDVWFVDTLAFTRLRELSMLEDEFESDRLDV